MLPLRVLLVLCAVSSVVVAAEVAPGDEEQLCQDLRANGVAPTPSYAANMSPLMDSWNYQNLLPPRTGAVWDQVDNDTNNPDGVTTNWMQNSNLPCRQVVNVCGFSAGPQYNWLLTQLINRTTTDGTLLSEVSVLLEFELRNCDTTLNCQRTFNTRIYETSSVDNAARRNLSNYRQVRRVSPDITTGARVNETVVVTFQTNQPSFYFAVLDETSCIVVTRILVFYHICPSQIIELVSAPEILAPVSEAPYITVSATCASNAETEDGSAPKLICSTGGIWTALGSGCRCAPGSGFINGACSSCPIGTYSSLSNGDCSTCPANSVSTSPGLAQCTCIEGYYRAVTGEEDLSCTLPPLPPKNVCVTATTDSSISVSWDPPAENPGGRNLTYSVYTSLDGGATRVLVANVPVTSATIMNLLPGRMYTLFVSTASAITDQIPDEQFSTISVAQQASTTGAFGSPLELFSSTEVAVAAIVPSLFAMLLLLILITIIIVFVRKQQIYKETLSDSTQNKAYYSTVGPPLPPPILKVEGNVAYEEIHCEPDKSSNISESKNNIAYGVHIH